MGLPKWLTSEEFTCQGGRRRRYEFDPWVRKIPWRRKWQPTPVLLPGESNGQRSLADYRPWGHKRKWTWFSDYTTKITHGARNICLPPRASVPGWEHLLLLLLSHFSRVRLGFSRQEHWSGLPFPSPMHKSEKLKWSRSVMSDCSRHHGLQPTRLLHPWDFLGQYFHQWTCSGLGDNVRCDTSCIRPSLWASVKPQIHSCHWSHKDLFHSSPGVPGL